jgi:UDP-N-acetylmuramate dehydrogenase
MLSSPHRRPDPSAVSVPHFEVGPDQIKIPAAWLIEQCGLKGVRLGEAAVYERQPLVIVNATGTARPEDIIALERKVIDSVLQKFGIELSPEVEHI